MLENVRCVRAHRDYCEAHILSLINIVAMEQEFLDLRLNIRFDLRVGLLESNLSAAPAENSKHGDHSVSAP